MCYQRNNFIQSNNFSELKNSLNNILYHKRSTSQITDGKILFRVDIVFLIIKYCHKMKCTILFMLPVKSLLMNQNF